MAVSDSHADGHSRPRTSTGRITPTHADSNPDADANRDPRTDADSHTYAHANNNADSHCDANDGCANRHAHANNCPGAHFHTAVDHPDSLERIPGGLRNG